MKLIKRIFYSLLLLAIGWFLNFFIDTQFVLGVVAGWLMKEGYDNLAKYLISIN